VKFAASEVSDTPSDKRDGANNSDKEVFVEGEVVDGEGKKKERSDQAEDKRNNF